MGDIVPFVKPDRQLESTTIVERIVNSPMKSKPSLKNTAILLMITPRTQHEDQANES